MSLTLTPATTPVLTDHQRQHFHTWGFHCARGILAADEVAELSTVFDQLMASAAKEVGHTGERNLLVGCFIDLHPRLRALFADPRVMDLAEGLLGDDCVFFGSTSGHLFAGNTRWHCDGGRPGWGPVTFAFYLDPLVKGGGCLNVVPGSHHPGFHEHVKTGLASGLFDQHSPDLPGREPLPSNPGDIVIFHHALYHSSWGGRRDRRMFSLTFARAPEHPGHEVSHLHGMAALRKPWKLGHRLFSEHLAHGLGARASRRTAKLVEMGFMDQRRPAFPEDLAFHVHRPSAG